MSHCRPLQHTSAQSAGICCSHSCTQTLRPVSLASNSTLGFCRIYPQVLQLWRTQGSRPPRPADAHRRKLRALYRRHCSCCNLRQHRQHSQPLQRQQHRQQHQLGRCSMHGLGRRQLEGNSLAANVWFNQCRVLLLTKLCKGTVMIVTESTCCGLQQQWL